PASRQPAMTFDLGAVGTRLPVGTHVLAILGLNQATNSSDFIQIADFSLATNNPNCVSGAISVNTTWHATNSPIPVCGNLTINSHCYFPSATAQFELCHGTGGVKPGGHGLFLRNFFGKATGYNDVVDFTGGNRPSLPIVHFIENVVTGGDDDGFDLDGTDAWVEGNIFLHLHKNGGTPDRKSVV